MQPDQIRTGRNVYKAISGVIGPMTRVTNWLDENEINSVDVGIFESLPQPALTTFSTFTLHSSSNVLEGNDIRVELLAVSSRTDEKFAHILSTCAFNVGKDGWLAAPGVVFPDVVSTYVSDTTVPHIMWSDPFVWPELSTLEVDGVGDVHCLLGMPVSDSEVNYLHEHGMGALETAFEQANVNYPDLHRAPVV